MQLFWFGFYCLWELKVEINEYKKEFTFWMKLSWWHTKYQSAFRTIIFNHFSKLEVWFQYFCFSLNYADNEPRRNNCEFWSNKILKKLLINSCILLLMKRNYNNFPLRLLEHHWKSSQFFFSWNWFFHHRVQTNRKLWVNLKIPLDNQQIPHSNL